MIVDDPDGLQIFYPASSTQPRRVRILMDYLTERFRQDEISLDDQNEQDSGDGAKSQDPGAERSLR